MKSITIHKLDDELEQKLCEMAKQSGTSLNQLVKTLLRQHLGLEKSVVDHSSDFKEFCGQWSEDEADQFDQAVECFSRIDKENWE